jgi:uncharacterized protein (DUF1330 family)
MRQETPAYLIGHITVKDDEKWDEYCGKVPDTLAPWGAQLVFRGKRRALLSGAHPHPDTVVIRFPNAAALDGWFHSPAYQALIALRNLAAEVVLIGYDAA